MSLPYATRQSKKMAAKGVPAIYNMPVENFSKINIVGLKPPEARASSGEK